VFRTEQAMAFVSGCVLSQYRLSRSSRCTLASHLGYRTEPVIAVRAPTLVQNIPCELTPRRRRRQGTAILRQFITDTEATAVPPTHPAPTHPAHVGSLQPHRSYRPFPQWLLSLYLVGV